MNWRKKLLAAFIAVIIIVLLFSVLWIVVLYLWWPQRQAWYPDTQIPEVDLSFTTDDGEVVTIPAENLEWWTATVSIGEDGETVIENEEADSDEEVPAIPAEEAPTEETLPENTEE